MRILLLTHSLTAGGEQRVASLWATGFINRGHEVALVLGSSKKLPRSYHVSSQTKIYHVYSLLAHYLYRGLGVKWYYTIKLKQIIKDFRPDLIISLHHPWTEWAKIATTGTKVPIISTEHTTFERPESAKMPPIVYQRKYELNRQYDFVTVLTAADKACLKGHLDKVAVLPNPLAYTPVTVIPPKENIILAVGQLHSWHYKGLDILIRAWGQISKQHLDWKLQIAGRDGNNSQSYLQAIANEYDLGTQLEFLGFQSDMYPIYQRASIFVLSSRYEGFGMALTEAMSQGCACIACDYKGRQHEIITEESQGILCPPEDVAALAAAIKRMLTDTNYRAMAQKNAVERSHYYHINNIMNQWESIIKEVMTAS